MITPQRLQELKLSGLLIDLVKCEDTVRRALLNFGHMTNTCYAPEGSDLARDPEALQVCGGEACES